MSTKVLNQCQALVFKDYKLLKFIFIILASYLILEEVYTCFVLQPNYTSHERRKIVAQDFPEILICPGEPNIDIFALKDQGYYTPEAYFKGRNNPHGLDQIGWAGNWSNSVKKVSEELSILKSIEDCPKAYVMYKDNVSLKYDYNITYNLTKALYPNHICCKVILPKAVNLYPIIGVQFTFSGWNSSSMNGEWQVSMAEKLTASFFDQHKTIMIGDKILSNLFGVVNYKVKILEDNNLEDDPKHGCIYYKIQGEYADCLEREIVRQNLKYLNCTPPWMTDDENLWCKGKYNFKSSQTSMNFLDFVNEISVSEANPGICLVPCKVKRYQVKKIGLQEVSDYDEDIGIAIWFEKEVDVSKSILTMDFKTLMSKIGGFIGISKNFLWLLVLSISSFGVLKSHIKKCFQYV